MSPPTPAPRELITRYHTLQKQLASLPYNASFPTPAARQAHASLLRARLAQISLPTYQQASLEGESRKSFDVTVWVLSNLPSGHRILDVGSIVHRFPELHQGRPLDVTSIDLHSADERVRNVDFFEFASDGVFDAVVLSLCVNFVGCPRRRGAMVKKAAGLLTEEGRLFVVLPAACVRNSRYCDEAVLKRVLMACGLGVVEVSYEGKLCVAIGKKGGEGERVGVKRRLVRGGRERNNFAIIVDHGGDGGTGNVKVGGREKGRGQGGVDGKGKRNAGVKAARRKGGIVKTTSNQRRRARQQAKRAQKGHGGVE